MSVTRIPSTAARFRTPHVFRIECSGALPDRRRASPGSIHRFSSWSRYPETTKALQSNLPGFLFRPPSFATRASSYSEQLFYRACGPVSARCNRLSPRHGGVYQSSFQLFCRSHPVAHVPVKLPEKPNQALQRTPPQCHPCCLLRGLRCQHGRHRGGVAELGR